LSRAITLRSATPNDDQRERAGWLARASAPALSAARQSCRRSDAQQKREPNLRFDLRAADDTLASRRLPEAASRDRDHTGDHS